MSSSRRSVLELALDGCTLVFVPSFHGYGEFAAAAREVIGIDGVALELDAAVAEAFVLLVERHAPRSRMRLPGVLGVARTPPRARCGRVCLAPLISSDSLCESARLGVERGLPVYGIDLEHAAGRRLEPQSEPGLLPDSHEIRGLADLERYAEQVLALERAFDSPCERLAARNVHMARRLLDLAQRHRRLLVTIGLAHFPELLRLLAEPELKPLPAEQAPRLDWPAEPVVLSPGIAAAWMDRFPLLVAEYEEARRGIDTGEAMRAQSPERILQQAIARAYARCDDPQRAKLAGRPPGLRQRLAFEQMRVQHAWLAGRACDRLGGLLESARATCPRLVAPLAEELLRFPWLREGELPYRYVRQTRVPGRVRIGDREYILLDDAGETIRIPGADIEPGGKISSSSGRLRTWPPEDRIATIAARRLVRLAQEREPLQQPRPFRDVLWLGRGIDVRGTIREIARGARLPLAVRVPAGQARNRKQSTTDWPFPILYIFDLSPASGSWISWLAPRQGSDGNPTGEHYHGVVGHGVAEQRQGIKRVCWSAVVHFTPLCWEDPDLYRAGTRPAWQRWLDDGHEREMPIGSSDIRRLDRRLGQGATPAHDLLRLALEHSRGHASVVLAGGNALEAELHEVARGQGASISMHRAALLPENLLERIRIAHIVEWEYDDRAFWRGGSPVPGIEVAMGEGVDAFGAVDLGPFALPERFAARAQHK